MTDITLAAGLVAGAGYAYDAGSRAPRQEWLGPARQPYRSADQEDAAESTPLRLVGHKVLAQGAGRAARNRQDPAAADSAEIPSPDAADLPQVYSKAMGGSGYAARAIASFSQQLRGNPAAKGTQINTYA
jgi:hypothetical protein